MRSSSRIKKNTQSKRARRRALLDSNVPQSSSRNSLANNSSPSSATLGSPAVSTPEPRSLITTSMPITVHTNSRRAPSNNNNNEEVITIGESSSRSPTRITLHNHRPTEIVTNGTVTISRSPSNKLLTNNLTNSPTISSQITPSASASGLDTFLLNNDSLPPRVNDINSRVIEQQHQIPAPPPLIASRSTSISPPPGVAQTASSVLASAIFTQLNADGGKRTASPSPPPPPYEDLINVTANAESETNPTTVTMVNNLPPPPTTSDAETNTPTYAFDAANDNVDADLLPHPAPKSSWRSMAWKAGAVGAKATVSFIAGSSSAFFATINESGKLPAQVGASLPNWWNDMSTRQQFDSVLNGTCSLGINFLFAMESIPAAAHKFRVNVLKANQTSGEKFENALTVIMAASAAIAAAAIAHSSFGWTDDAIDNPAIDYIVTGTTFFTNLTTRYVGLRSLINRVRDANDIDAIAKRKFIKDLELIHEDYVNEVNGYIKTAVEESGGELNQEAIKLFAEKLKTELALNPNLLKEPNKIIELLLYPWEGLKISLAVVVGAAAWLTFTQKGFDGINKLYNESLNNLDRLYKGLIGAVPGLTHASLYTVNMYDFPQVTYDTIKHVIKYPRSLLDISSIGLFIALGIANYYASASMQSVSEGIEKDSDHIFNFLVVDTFIGVLDTLVNRLGGGVTNTNSSYRSTFVPNIKDPKIHDVTSLLKTCGHDKPIPSETLAAMRSFSQFAHPAPTPVTPVHDGYNTLTDADNVFSDLESGLVGVGNAGANNVSVSIESRPRPNTSIFALAANTAASLLRNSQAADKDNKKDGPPAMIL